MTLQQFAHSKATVLARAHAETLKKLRLLPNGELIAERYKTLVDDPKVIRYGVLLSLMFEDWLDLKSREKRSMFEQLHVQILCLYALILELDDFQDSNFQKRLEYLSESITIENLQKSLEENYSDTRSKYRTEWQNILINETLSLLKAQKEKFGVTIDCWIKHFNDSVKKASITFIQETNEDQITGRLEEKLTVATEKNQMIVASAVLLAPLAYTGFSDLLYETARKMMLPIQLIDDLYDWQVDYKEHRYTTLLRNVPNWTMTREELYVFLVEGGYFQELLLKSILLVNEIIESITDKKIGKTIRDLFTTTRTDLEIKLSQVEKFLLFIKKQKGGIL